MTRLDNFQDQGHIRRDYYDIDDFSMMHVVFEDDTIATVFASDIILGGIHNWLEVAATNHRTFCNINPNTAMKTYTPVHDYYKDVYTVEKTETKQGWTEMPPDEDWFTGYPQEIEAFYRTVAYGEPVESDSRLAADSIISTIYSAYVSAEQKGAEVAVRAIDPSQRKEHSVTNEQWEKLVAVINGERVELVPVGFIIDSPWLPNWAGMSILDYYAGRPALVRRQS